jgi:hypothetical protein
VNYTQFIARLESLIVEGHAIVTAGITHKDQRFRKWRHEAESVVDDAKSRGIRVPGDFNSSKRHYLAMWTGASHQDEVEALRSALNDSLIELEFIVQQHKLYGAPADGVSAQVKATPLQVPERVTLSWLWHNVPATLWLAAAGLVLAIFVAGVTAGQSKAYQDFVSLFERSASSP